MRLNRKGQVTIPLQIRNRLGLPPHTEVEFELAGDSARIRKARRPMNGGVRGQNAIGARRMADARMSTEEIMALTRGGHRRGKNGK